MLLTVPPLKYRLKCCLQYHRLKYRLTEMLLTVPSLNCLQYRRAPYNTAYSSIQLSKANYPLLSLISQITLLG